MSGRKIEESETTNKYNYTTVRDYHVSGSILAPVVLRLDYKFVIFPNEFSAYLKTAGLVLFLWSNIIMIISTPLNVL